MARSWTPSQEAAMTLRGRTLLVSAAAGSGKTSVLTERIIRSLTDEEHPADLSRMLVVTFTRAAAAELKSRIAAALTQALAENPANTRLSRQLFLLGSAQISTIDSFFQKAVRANFEQLGLPAAFRITDDHEMKPLCAEIMEGLTDEYYRKFEPPASQGRTLDRLNGNPFAEALDHLMSNRSDGKLTQTLLEFYNKFSAYPEGLALLRDCAGRLDADADRPFYQSSYGATIFDFLKEQNQGHLTFLQSILPRLEAEPDNYQRLCNLLASDTDYCTSLQRALEEGDLLRIRAVTDSLVTGRFLAKEKTNAVIAYQEWRDKFKKEQKKVSEYLSCSQEQISRHMEQTARFCQIMYQFFTDYQARMLEEKKSRGVLEYNDVRALLYSLLTQADGSPTPFARSLAEQYDAVYIDEYQDVDFMQDRIFACIGG
ncbi:MAG: UvrD-helicase domain-containing protein, partial [Clostridia bacterium]|nr:UvrD-helicase domain-containing protein [Clostridia bacterium]